MDGAIADSSGVTVNSSGTLSGTGIVDSVATTTIMSGGMLAPGNAKTPDRHAGSQTYAGTGTLRYSW